MRFASLDQAQAWRQRSRGLLAELEAIAAAVEGVAYTDTWLCGNAPSYVAGFNAEDEMLVCFPIRAAE